jgi:predicted CXXCH cytochrome family protein
LSINSQKRYRGIPLTVIIVLVLLGSWMSFASRQKAQHPLEAQCEDCHLVRGEITQANAGQLKASQERLCGGCHEDALRVSHPSGKSVSRTLPEVFPLDWKGDMTCSTCHDVHGSSAGLMRVPQRGADLCTQCHAAAFFTRMADGAESVLHSGHLDASGRLAGRKLDAFSFRCMECHAEETTIKGLVITGNIARHTGSSLNHPVGVSYQQAVAFGGYHPRERLNDAILLPGGVVSCISCHEGYSMEHGKLVMEGDNLCYECHDL